MNNDKRKRYVFFFICCGIIAFFSFAVTFSHFFVAAVLNNPEIATQFNFPRYRSVSEIQGPPELDENISYYLYRTNMIEKGRDINWTEIRNNGPYDCVVISDSFLVCKGGQYYIKKFAKNHNFKVLHIYTNHVEFCEDNPLIMLIILTNNGFIKETHAKYVLLGIAERSLAGTISGIKDLNMTKELPINISDNQQMEDLDSSYCKPIITNCSPSSGIAGHTVKVTSKAGSGFLSGATVILAPHTHHMNATNETVVPQQKITSLFSLLPNMTVKTYHIPIINPNQKSGANVQCMVESNQKISNRPMEETINSSSESLNGFFMEIMTSAMVTSEKINGFFSGTSTNLTHMKTWVKNDILSLIGGATNDKSLFFDDLNESRFTNPLYKSRLIYHNSDLAFKLITMPESLIVFDNQLDEVAVQLKKDNVTLIFIPGISAYSTYYVYIKDPPTPRDPFFEIMRTLNRSYIFVDTKEVSDRRQAQGVPDLSGIGDPAHWTWRLTEDIPDPIDLAASSEGQTSFVPKNEDVEFSNSVRAFRDVIYERNCRDTWALNNDARLYLKENDTLKAIKVYQKSLELNPNQPDIQNILGKLTS